MNRSHFVDKCKNIGYTCIMMWAKIGSMNVIQRERRCQIRMIGIEIEKAFNLILTESETSLFSFVIYPIKRKEYICFVIESGEKMYLLYGAYGAKEYLDFAKETMPDGTFFEKDFYETDSAREFVQLYRKRFFKKVEISDEETRAMIDRVCVLDWSKVTNDCQGFDGFSLLAYYPKKDETIRFWCNYHNDANTPFATLANAFLIDMGVDSAYRFGQCAKKGFPENYNCAGL